MTTALASFSNFNQLNNNYDYSLFLVFRDPDDEGEVWCEAGAGAGGDQSAQVWSSSQQGKTTILETKQSVRTLSTPLMMIQMAVLQLVSLDTQGRPSVRSLIAVLTIYIGVVMYNWGGRKMERRSVKESRRLES